MNSPHISDADVDQDVLETCMELLARNKEKRSKTSSQESVRLLSSQEIQVSHGSIYTVSSSTPESVKDEFHTVSQDCASISKGRTIHKWQEHVGHSKHNSKTTQNFHNLKGQLPVHVTKDSDWDQQEERLPQMISSEQSALSEIMMYYTDATSELKLPTTDYISKNYIKTAEGELVLSDKTLYPILDKFSNENFSDELKLNFSKSFHSWREQSSDHFDSIQDKNALVKFIDKPQDREKIKSPQNSEKLTTLITNNEPNQKCLNIFKKQSTCQQKILIASMENETLCSQVLTVQTEVKSLEDHADTYKNCSIGVVGIKTGKRNKSEGPSCQEKIDVPFKDSKKIKQLKCTEIFSMEKFEPVENKAASSPKRNLNLGTAKDEKLNNIVMVIDDSDDDDNEPIVNTKKILYKIQSSENTPVIISDSDETEFEDDGFANAKLPILPMQSNSSKDFVKETTVISKSYANGITDQNLDLKKLHKPTSSEEFISQKGYKSKVVKNKRRPIKTRKCKYKLAEKNKPGESTMDKTSKQDCTPMHEQDLACGDLEFGVTESFNNHDAETVDQDKVISDTTQLDGCANLNKLQNIGNDAGKVIILRNDLVCPATICDLKVPVVELDNRKCQENTYKEEDVTLTKLKSDGCSDKLLSNERQNQNNKEKSITVEPEFNGKNHDTSNVDLVLNKNDVVNQHMSDFNGSQGTNENDLKRTNVAQKEIYILLKRCDIPEYSIDGEKCQPDLIVTKPNSTNCAINLDVQYKEYNDQNLHKDTAVQNLSQVADLQIITGQDHGKENNEHISSAHLPAIGSNENHNLVESYKNDPSNQNSEKSRQIAKASTGESVAHNNDDKNENNISESPKSLQFKKRKISTKLNESKLCKLYVLNDTSYFDNKLTSDSDLPPAGPVAENKDISRVKKRTLQKQHGEKTQFSKDSHKLKRKPHKRSLYDSLRSSRKRSSPLCLDEMHTDHEIGSNILGDTENTLLFDNFMKSHLEYVRRRTASFFSLEKDYLNDKKTSKKRSRSTRQSDNKRRSHASKNKTSRNEDEKRKTELNTNLVVEKLIRECEADEKNAPSPLIEDKLCSPKSFNQAQTMQDIKMRIKSSLGTLKKRINTIESECTKMNILLQKIFLTLSDEVVPELN